MAKPRFKKMVFIIDGKSSITKNFNLLSKKDFTYEVVDYSGSFCGVNQIEQIDCHP